MRKFLRIFSIILLVLWMGLIFFFSGQTADNSSETSGQVIEVIAEKFYPDFEQMTEIEKEEFISSLQFTVRKTAHIGIYAVLGFLAFLTFISYVNLHFFARIFWAAAVSCVYAAGDEFHQRFVVGRSCEFRDFLLDTAGILAAIIICSLFVKIISPLRRKTAFAGVTKKSLMNQNYELYQKLDKAYYRNKTLEDRIDEHKAVIEKLETELQQKAVAEELAEEIPETVEEPEADLPEEVDSEPKTDSEVIPTETEKREMKINDELEYAAKVIGICVVEVTKVCNKLTADGQDETKKELVNLALGRNEVLKSEILKIMNMEIEFSQKKDLIERERQETFDYFDSIIAQIS